ncbi:uncharacterized protein NECHADRAFT_83117 [Fusarium vanettenii 77-13-4]|uniref:Tryptophan synthase beta chain-like PALP domain-containing protein n=1 Tax=Fusarium vanettenii (strain ATCC MYA-4622 / CBS 123669 / FGSC 9596 / NRRL 45880 / 77-13-4) TaxID=660122 RepID=C7ZB02_FUSV7|nr:uncharacterized protein NECHADRAFT_83117 [Fusarium vanettenii 77-13-4]EEU38827.1 hypothetical protein NECHADRAFT_83117 [Fusarium vanettenii 77-13-4]
MFSTLSATPLVYASRMSSLKDAQKSSSSSSTSNPTGSCKGRMAKSIIEEAEKSGRLKPSMAVVEASGGNTGSSLALVCAAKGYNCHIVTSNAFAVEKLRTMSAIGTHVEIIHCPSGKIHADLIPSMICRVAEHSQDDQMYWTDQFNNRDGFEGYEVLESELVEQFPNGVDAFCGVVGAADPGGSAELFIIVADLLFKDVTMINNESCGFWAPFLALLMRGIYGLGFIFLDGTFGQKVGIAIPGCVSDCIRSMKAECDSGAVMCLHWAYKGNRFIDELSSCLKEGCNPDEVVLAEDFHGPLYARVDRPKIGLEGRITTTADANAPPIVGQGESLTTLGDDTQEVMSTEDANAPPVIGQGESLTTLSEDTEEAVSTKDSDTSTSIDSVKAGVAASASTTKAVAETTASTSTKSSIARSTSTKEEQATETVLPASDKYYPGGGLSAGAKAGIGVGVALGVMGFGCLVAAIWLMRRRRAIMGAPGTGVTHARPLKSPRQVEVAEIDGRPAPQELPA